jgi:sigma-B regulation protein RsbU (phosphoserine phosphatase)
LGRSYSRLARTEEDSAIGVGFVPGDVDEADAGAPRSLAPRHCPLFPAVHLSLAGWARGQPKFRRLGCSYFVAREIQQWLVPDRPPFAAGLDIAFATRPQNTVAGDYYDAFFRPLPPEGSETPPLLVVVADVAGKSVPAALLMATFQASLRALAATPVTLDDIVVGLDRYCRAHSLEGRRFTTAFLAEINPKSREMIFVNAGHNDPILRRASGQIERLSTGGPPFGLPLFTDEPLPYPSGRVLLQPGDLLIIFTDGVVEAVNNAGDEYGEARLLACIQTALPQSSDETLKQVMADVNAFVGYARQHDDITCLVLRVSA